MNEDEKSGPKNVIDENEREFRAAARKRYCMDCGIERPRAGSSRCSVCAKDHGEMW